MSLYKVNNIGAEKLITLSRATPINMENKGGVFDLIKKPSKSRMDRKEILIFHCKRCFNGSA